LNGRWFPILSTTVYDPNGNSTTIEFSNLRVNFGISDMSFNFIMPAGVQVVRPTGQEMGF
jgi:outer membrane lipoprotein carrier protein